MSQPVRKSALCVLGLVVAALVALGLVVLFSASEVRSIRVSGQPWHFVTRQAAYVVCGILISAVVALIDYHRWRDQWILTVILSAVIIVALWVVVLFLPAVKGSHRWIPLPGGINFQPSEIAKILTVLAVAVYMDKAGWRVELFWRGAAYPAVIIALFAIPVMKAPDYGSVMVIAAVGFMVMFVAGTRILHLMIPVIPGIAFFVWEVIHNPNRMARLFSFAGAAEAGADTAAYQSGMSIVAISRGGWLGVGLGKSMQKQNYLPEAWTDFILAVGAEELGLVFSIVVLILFLALFFTCVYIARKASDRLGRFIALGMSVIIFFQAMFNMGVVCEAFPTKGMALPFFSYGGTNMVATFIAIGFIFSVGIHSADSASRRLSRKGRTD